MSAHKFIFTTIILVVIGVIMYGIAVLSFYETPYRSTKWIKESYAVKEAYSKEIGKQKKLVLVGGSSVLFGTRAADIEAYFGTPVLNMGMHAALDADYLLHKTKSVLQSGDVVVLSIEYGILTRDGTNPVLTDYLLSEDHDYLLNMGFSSQLSIIYGISFEKIVKALYFGFLDKKDRGYSALTLNKNGDQTKNQGSKKILKKLKELRVMPVPPVKDLKQTSSFKSVMEFRQFCLNNNIKLYIAWPNTLHLKEYDNAKYQNYFSHLVAVFKDSGLSVLGFPRESLYPKDMFFDTENHLNEIGMTLATKQLIEQMENNNVL